jgi:hypothetical protein
MKKTEGSKDNFLIGYFKSVVGISNGDNQVERLDSLSVQKQLYMLLNTVVKRDKGCFH